MASTGSRPSGPPLIAIAAGAEGGAALQRIFAGLPRLTGSALVVTLPAASPADLAREVEAVRQHSGLPTVVAVDGAFLQADHVYLVQAGAAVSVAEDRLVLKNPAAAAGAALVIALPGESPDDGMVAGAVLALADLAEMAKARADLRDSEARYRLIVESATDYAIITMDAGRRVTGWNPGAESLFGWSQDEVLGQSADLIFTEEDQAAGRPREEVQEARESGRASDDRWHVRRDGSRFFAAGALMPLLGEMGGFVKIVRDRTAERLQEDRRRLMVSELQHRVKNILAVVRSVASRTLETTDSVEDFAAHFDGRLQALARTQNALSRSAMAFVDLESSIRDELVSHAVAADQVEIQGPRISLRSKAAETFALAIHELATNAVKYGALASPRGRIDIAWRITKTEAGPRLSLEWRERNVAVIEASPRRQGFGRDLIERGLPYDLGAETSLEFSPGGVICTISIPLDGDLARPDGIEERT